MEVVVKGNPKEIAALVVAIQERRDGVDINSNYVAQAICDRGQETQESK